MSMLIGGRSGFRLLYKNANRILSTNQTINVRSTVGIISRTVGNGSDHFDSSSHTENNGKTKDIKSGKISTTRTESDIASEYTGVDDNIDEKRLETVDIKPGSLTESRWEALSAKDLLTSATESSEIDMSMMEYPSDLHERQTQLDIKARQRSDRPKVC